MIPREKRQNKGAGVQNSYHGRRLRTLMRSSSTTQLMPPILITFTMSNAVTYAWFSNLPSAFIFEFLSSKRGSYRSRLEQ